MSDNIYYVYGLIDPRSDEIFYIGKGKDNRVYSHYCKSSLVKNSHKNNTIKQYRSLGLKDNYVKIIENISEQEAYFQEIYWISFLGRANKNEGLLTNSTDGGDNPPKTYGKNNVAHRLLAEGRCPLQGLRNPNNKKNEEGISYASLKARKRVDSGTHNFQNIPFWNRPNSTKTSKQIWINADLFYNIYQLEPNVGRRRLKSIFEKENRVFLPDGCTNMIIKKFRSGWVPNQDVDWILHKESTK